MFERLSFSTAHCWEAIERLYAKEISLQKMHKVLKMITLWRGCVCLLLHPFFIYETIQCVLMLFGIRVSEFKVVVNFILVCVGPV
jgi:hypothetical protein